jgi:hypothetical protein
VPLAVTFAAIGLNTAFGAPVPDIAEFSVWYGLPMAIAINMVNPLNAQLPEEANRVRLTTGQTQRETPGPSSLAYGEA